MRPLKMSSSISIGSPGGRTHMEPLPGAEWRPVRHHVRGRPSKPWRALRVWGGGGYKVLYGFRGSNDGANPFAGVVQDSAGNLYGTTYSGGPANAGVLYKVAASGQETVLYAFTGGADGGNPYAGIILDSAATCMARRSMAVSRTARAAAAWPTRSPLAGRKRCYTASRAARMGLTPTRGSSAIRQGIYMGLRPKGAAAGELQGVVSCTN